jgi:hypothetical protein
MLAELQELQLYHNQINDISVLSGLTKLKSVGLYKNQISDISVFGNKTGLTSLLLAYNPLNKQAYCLYLPLIQANNPGINLTYDPNPYGSCNNPPVCDAGENLNIAGENQNVTVIEGASSDSDEDPLLYRWMEGASVLKDWSSVGPDGDAILDLASLERLALGSHVFTLEVSDGTDICSDSMMLSVSNSSPHAAPIGSGVYEVNSEVVLGGQVSDFDGDQLNYAWWKEGATIYNGLIATNDGGDPVDLPGYSVYPASLGIHEYNLTVDDGVNAPVAAIVIVEIVDTSAPVLAPVPNKTILWPPNHQLIDISIQANASDNSGNRPVLTASVSSNEPVEGLGDGDTSPDWTEPLIDQINGIVMLKLRSERSGSGDGRLYTITLTAADDSGNTSKADVKIIVPHDRSKK